MAIIGIYKQVLQGRREEGYVYGRFHKFRISIGVTWLYKPELQLYVTLTASSTQVCHDCSSPLSMPRAEISDPGDEAGAGVVSSRVPGKGTRY